MGDSDLIGTLEAAGILCISQRSVKRYAKNGTLPYVLKMGGDTGAYLFDRSDVLALAAAAEKAS